MKHLVFVYGSLRRGAHNHHIMQQAEFIAAWQTIDQYTLYSLGSYPVAIARGQHSLSGEIYKVSQPQLQQLDQLEGYPRIYQRDNLNTDHGSAWIYTMSSPPAHAKQLFHGDWFQELGLNNN